MIEQVERKISKDIEDLNTVLSTNLTDLTVIYEIFHPSNRIYVLLKHTGNTHQDRPYADTKRNLSKFKRIEIIQSMFSEKD